MHLPETYAPITLCTLPVYKCIVKMRSICSIAFIAVKYTHTHTHAHNIYNSYFFTPHPTHPHPQGFLTAVKQEVTRKHAASDKWALDDVVMVSQVVMPCIKDPEGVRDAPSEGVYIHGLYLDGAAWNHKYVG